MEDKVLLAVRSAARITRQWRKKQIAVLGGAVLLVANQTGRSPASVWLDVKEWLDDRIGAS